METLINLLWKFPKVTFKSWLKSLTINGHNDYIYTLSTLVIRSEYKNLSDETLGIQAKLQLEMINFQNMTQDLEENFILLLKSCYDDELF